MDNKTIENIEIQAPTCEIKCEVEIQKNVFIHAPTYIIGTQTQEKENDNG